MEWISTDTWIVVTGSLVAMACALPGVFLILNRQSMLGDGISHAVLPGLAIAFLVTNSRDASSMLVGAVLAGVLTAFMTRLIHQFGQVDGGAALGVVFTTLFAVGLILIRFALDHVDLDPGCVLYGSLETSTISGMGVVPQVVWMSLGALLINVVVVLFFYKELMVSSFDPQLSDALGISSRAMHYVLTVMTAVTAVFAFESVGSILVIAMLIVPGATAYLLSDRLPVLILIALVVGVLSAVGGHLAAVLLPPLIFSRIPGFEGVGATGSSGMMAFMSGVLFFLVFLFSPHYGVIRHFRRRSKMNLSNEV